MVTTAAYLAARRVALAELADYSRRSPLAMYGALLALDGVGTTTMFRVLRDLERDELIAAERTVDGRVRYYRRATPTDVELHGAAS